MASMIGKTQLSTKLVVLLAFALLLPVAQASVLTAGGAVPPSPLFPAGTTLATATGTIVTPTWTATYTAKVVMDPGNTWCVGCLDFLYQFTNLGANPLERFSMSSFAGFLLDVGTNPFGVHDPSTVNMSLTGGVVGFNYNPGLDVLPGETTPWLIIETNATHFTTGYLSAQDGTAGSGKGYEPTLVPEPGSLMLMGSGLLAIGGILRRARFGR